MAFNELNSVEHFIINQLSGVNLNSNELQESKVTYGAHWQYKSAVDGKHMSTHIGMTTKLLTS
jgi:type I restriction enzyme R subunit